jgi:hypothetical protein
MSQATLDDEDLFDEAATEMREDVESSVQAAMDALPDADAVWAAKADNTLGVLNGLKGALDTGDAEDHLRDAKKWFAMGRKADAFEDAEDLETEIAELEETLSQITTAHEGVSELTSVIPELRETLADAEGTDD